MMESLKRIISIGVMSLILLLVSTSGSAAELPDISDINSIRYAPSDSVLDFDEYQDEAQLLRDFLDDSARSKASDVQAPAGIDEGLSLWLRQEKGDINSQTVENYSNSNLVSKYGALTQFIVFKQPSQNSSLQQNKIMSYRQGPAEQLSLSVGPSISVTKGSESMSWALQANKRNEHVVMLRTENIFGVTDVYYDGQSLNTEEVTFTDKITSDATLTLGSFSTDILEVIHYNRELSQNERKHIESYLMLKYDMSFGDFENIINKDGDIVWDSIENSAYKHNRAVIGRSDTSELLWQVDSSIDASENSLTISTDSLENESYVFWADNGQKTTLQQSKHAAYAQKFARMWKMQVTGDVKKVDVSLSGSAFVNNLTKNDPHDIALLIMDDPFTEEGVLYIPSSIENDVVLFENVDIGTGKYMQVLFDKKISDVEAFLGTQQVLGVNDVQAIGPGGIGTNLMMWLRGDKAILNSDGSVYMWIDQSGENNDLTADLPYAFGTAPMLVNRVLNFNPAIRFNNHQQDQLTDYLGRSDFALAGEENNFTLFTVMSREQTDRFEGIVSYASDIDTNDLLLFDPSRLWLFKNGKREVTNLKADNGKPHIVTLRNNETVGATDVYLDGQGSTLNFGSEGHQIGGTFLLGQDQDDVGGGFDTEQAFQGDIAEVILLHDAVSDIDRLKIDSYLGIKYGVSLKTMYVRSDGHVIWDPEFQDGYNNGIAGIGQDDASGLEQLASRSDIVTIKGPTDMNNGEFLVWGHSGTDVTYKSKEISRTWYVQETGNVGNVHVSFDLKGIKGIDVTTSPQFTLLMSTDGTFTQSKAHVESTLDGYTVTFLNIDLENKLFMKLLVSQPDENGLE